MRVTRRSLTAALAAILFGVAMLDTAPAANVVKIRLSYTVPISNSASILLEKKDLARHLGKSYQLEVTRFAGTPLMITAMAFVVFTLPKHGDGVLIRPISARYMHKKEVESYEKSYPDV
jgi:uncharacterized DUF497 family protein